MAERILVHENEICYPTYRTEFHWTLQEWPLILSGEAHPEGIYSEDFELHGSVGYTYKLRLQPYEFNPLSIVFPERNDVLTIGVRCKFDSFETYEKFLHKPSGCCPLDSLESDGYLCGKSLTEYLLSNSRCRKNTLLITVEIRMIKKNENSSSMNTRMKIDGVFHQNCHGALTNIIPNLKTLFDSKTLCDITLVLGDRKISAHKTILAAQSNVFKAMFLSAMKETENNTVEIINIEVEMFEKFLNYLYTGEVTGIEEVADELMAIADYYEVDRLKTICENYMLTNLSEENAAKYVPIADKFRCSVLKKTALYLIRKSQTILKRAIEEKNHEILEYFKESSSNDSQQQ